MDSYELGPALWDSVHKLRNTRKGIQQLERMGLARPYMDDRLKAASRRGSRARSAKAFKQFIAWDGEGWSDVDGLHRYMLMMCSTGEYVEHPQLNTSSCLRLLVHVGARNPGAIHVIYGGGYDVTHIVRDLPWKLRDSLLNGEWVTAVLNGTESYRLHYVRHKWFTVMSRVGGKLVTVKLYDVMTFFQQSFIKALESRGIDVPERVRSGKAHRNTFSFEQSDEIKLYCAEELDLLVQLCNQLRREFLEAGVAVTKWYGPGAVADATLRHYGVRKLMQRPSDEIERVAQHAYFGGRFECVKVGHYEGTVYQADINSAYPYAISLLPNLSGARWEEVTVFDGSPGLYLCRFNDRHIGGIHALPWRDKGGSVGYPRQNIAVWCWHTEAVHATSVERGYRLITDGTRPFRFINGIYRKRKEWKAKGKGGERALKLQLNSLYGKFAQRIGGKPIPPWHQLEWAGMITSLCRSMVYEAAMQKPDSVIAFETDSVTTTERLDLDYGDGLGQWELTEYEGITYLQSGLYFVGGKSGSVKAKTRGINVADIDERSVLEYFDSGMREPIRLVQRQFIALGNPQRGLYGQWIDSVKEVGLPQDGKRLHVPKYCGACADGRSFSESLHSTIAHPLYGSVASAPHTLPWRDTELVFDPEIVPTDAIAIEEWQ